MNQTRKNRENNSGEMPFWDHLDALRKVLIQALLLLTAVGAGCFAAMPWLMDHVIMAPCSSDFILYRWLASFGGGMMPDFAITPFEIRLINLNLSTQFFLHFSLSLWTALILAFPGLLYLLWSFVEPGLRPEEKRGARTAYLLGTVMFYIGVAVGYLLVFPLTLRFLATYNLTSAVTNTLSLDSYMDNFLTLILTMGIIFELPLIAWMLGRLHILTRTIFTRFRRHAIVALLILAAVVTPTGDPFTLAVVFLPLYLLWETSALLVPSTTTTVQST